MQVRVVVVVCIITRARCGEYGRKFFISDQNFPLRHIYPSRLLHYRTQNNGRQRGISRRRREFVDAPRLGFRQGDVLSPDSRWRVVVIVLNIIETEMPFFRVLFDGVASALEDVFTVHSGRAETDRVEIYREESETGGIDGKASVV
jgi:hypothetical protein